MTLRLSAKWMNLSDDRVLELLAQEGPHTPARIARDDRILFSRQTVNMRLLLLEKTGFVNSNTIGPGVYDIAQQGEAYLSGEFDARDLEKPDG